MIGLTSPSVFSSAIVSKIGLGRADFPNCRCIVVRRWVGCTTNSLSRSCGPVYGDYAHLIVAIFKMLRREQIPISRRDIRYFRRISEKLDDNE